MNESDFKKIWREIFICGGEILLGITKKSGRYSLSAKYNLRIVFSQK